MEGFCCSDLSSDCDQDWEEVGEIQGVCKGVKRKLGGEWGVLETEAKEWTLRSRDPRSPSKLDRPNMTKLTTPKGIELNKKK